MKHERRAFTLVELMVVLSVVVLLAALIMAALGPAREEARQNVCISNLHQIGAALSLYRSDYDGQDASVGTRMQYWQLGLPDPGQQFDDFARTYIHNRGVLVCPDYHGDVPVAQMGTTYELGFGPDDDRPTYVRFSHVVARRGDMTPILFDTQHNGPIDPAKLPAWAQELGIILRLNNQVVKRWEPVRGGIQPVDW